MGIQIAFLLVDILLNLLGNLIHTFLHEYVFANFRLNICLRLVIDVL